MEAWVGNSAEEDSLGHNPSDYNLEEQHKKYVVLSDHLYMVVGIKDQKELLMIHLTIC